MTAPRQPQPNDPQFQQQMPQEYQQPAKQPKKKGGKNGCGSASQ